jgi:hypothetical protein
MSSLAFFVFGHNKHSFLKIKTKRRASRDEKSALKRNCELYEHRMPFMNGIYRTILILFGSHK